MHPRKFVRSCWCSPGILYNLAVAELDKRCNRTVGRISVVVVSIYVGAPSGNKAAPSGDWQVVELGRDQITAIPWTVCMCDDEKSSATTRYLDCLEFSLEASHNSDEKPRTVVCRWVWANLITSASNDCISSNKEGGVCKCWTPWRAMHEGEFLLQTKRGAVGLQCCAANIRVRICGAGLHATMHTVQHLEARVMVVLAMPASVKHRGFLRVHVPHGSRTSGGLGVPVCVSRGEFGGQSHIASAICAYHPAVALFRLHPYMSCLSVCRHPAPRHAIPHPHARARVASLSLSALLAALLQRRLPAGLRGTARLGGAIQRRCEPLLRRGHLAELIACSSAGPWVVRAEIGKLVSVRCSASVSAI